jgi:hypothetical protein
MPSLFPSVQTPFWLAGIFASIWNVWSAVWWIVVPVIFIIVAWEAWILYLHVKFLESIRWKVLEIKIPKNVLKTPKAMEQIFAAAHAPYSYGLRFSQKYIKGEDEQFFSFELIGRNGETHFYLRTPEPFRNMMESAIYGQYPEAEIVEVEDYLKQMPKILPSRDFDVAGFEEVFKQKSCYPIRTYAMFEEAVEERRIDPVGSLVEAMSKMEGDQQFWMQLIIVPTGNEVVEEGEEEINKLLGIEDHKKKSGGFFPDFDLGFTLGEALRAPFEHPGAAGAKKDHKEERQQRFIVSPNAKEIADGIQKKISKLGFETTLRFVFIERRGESSGGVDKAAFLGHGYIRQFNTTNMNQLRPDKPTTTASYAIRGLFKKTRVQWRKRIMYERYRHLTHNAAKPVLNIEELATIYHFPLNVVSTTELEKIESRKGSPPASLPIIEE